MTYAAYTCDKGAARGAIITQAVGPSQSTVSLLDGEDAFLPSLQSGDWYYAYLRSPCGDCEHVKVTASPSADTLTIVRMSPTPACFRSGSTITYDGKSALAIQAMQTGQVKSVSAPFTFNAETGAITFDVNELQRLLPGMLQDAVAPLVYDNTSGVIHIDMDALANELKSTILGWITGTSPVVVSSGAISLDIGALKSQLGIA